MNNGTIISCRYSDMSGRTANDWLSIKFDSTAPIMVVSNIPVITDDEILVVEIQTEWDAEFRHNGEVVETSPTGNATIQINLDESQELNWNNPFMTPKSGYLVEGIIRFLSVLKIQQVINSIGHLR